MPLLKNNFENVSKMFEVWKKDVSLMYQKQITMQVRNDKNRVKKDISISDIIYISGVKYSVYEITEKSVKIKSEDKNIPAGIKRKDFININTFAKTYFFDKVRLTWVFFVKRSIPNFDYM